MSEKSPMLNLFFLFYNFATFGKTQSFKLIASKKQINKIWLRMLELNQPMWLMRPPSAPALRYPQKNNLAVSSRLELKLTGPKPVVLPITPWDFINCCPLLGLRKIRANWKDLHLQPHASERAALLIWHTVLIWF